MQSPSCSTGNPNPCLGGCLLLLAFKSRISSEILMPVPRFVVGFLLSMGVLVLPKAIFKSWAPDSVVPEAALKCLPHCIDLDLCYGERNTGAWVSVLPFSLSSWMAMSTLAGAGPWALEGWLQISVQLLRLQLLKMAHLVLKGRGLGASWIDWGEVVLWAAWIYYWNVLFPEKLHHFQGLMEPYFSLGQCQKNWKVVPCDPSFKGEHGNKTFVDVLEADTFIWKRHLQSC